MYSFSETITHEIHYLSFCIKMAEKKLAEYKDLHPGELISLSQNGNTTYHERRRKQTNGKRTGQTKKLGSICSSRVRDIMMYRFHNTRLAFMKNDLDYLQKMTGCWKPYDTKSVLACMPPLYSAITSMPEINPGSINRSEARYKKNSRKKYPPFHITADGTYVRSQIEARIYDTLMSYGIRFRYDGIIEFRDADGYAVRRSPDFVIICNDGTFIYWEHFGRLDLPEYREDFLKKMALYIRNDLKPSIDLIITSSEKNGATDFEMINNTILHNILPRVMRPGEREFPRD